MKKLYNGKGKRVHPTPPPRSHRDFMAALPAAVITLAAVLSPEDKEVLSYLLSGGKKRPFSNHRRPIHPPKLSCGCFGCYKSFWVRWDASPNRHIIHLILDAVEDPPESPSPSDGRPLKDSAEETPPSADDGVGDGEEEEIDNLERDGAGAGDCRSPVTRLVSFIGERLWGVWSY